MIDDDFTPIYMKCYKIMLECTVFNPHLNYKHRKKRKSVLSTQIWKYDKYIMALSQHKCVLYWLKQYK